MWTKNQVRKQVPGALSLSQLWGMLSTPFWPWQEPPQQLHSAVHTPQGNTRTFFSRGKYLTMLPSFYNHCALVVSLLLKVWAARMFKEQWTQLINDLRGRQTKSFWVEKFQFKHVFYLVLKEWVFSFFYCLCSFRVWFNSQPPLHLSDTPHATGAVQEGGAAVHTSPSCVSRCKRISGSAPYHLINPDCSSNGMSGALKMCEIMSQTLYLLSFILVSHLFNFLLLLLQSSA